MRFELDQRFPGSVGDVEAALIDPEFLTALGELPNLAAPELLDQQRAGDVVHQRARYRFTGQVSRAVRAVVDPRKLSWVEDSSIDLARHRSELRMLPDHYPDRLRCHATTVLESDGDGSRRRTDGELVVSVPLVGRRVETAIVSGLRDHADAEVELFRRWWVERG